MAKNKHPRLQNRLANDFKAETYEGFLERYEDNPEMLKDIGWLVADDARYCEDKHERHNMYKLAAEMFGDSPKDRRVLAKRVMKKGWLNSDYGTEKDFMSFTLHDTCESMGKHYTGAAKRSTKLESKLGNYTKSLDFLMEYSGTAFDTAKSIINDAKDFAKADDRMELYELAMEFVDGDREFCSELAQQIMEDARNCQNTDDAMSMYTTALDFVCDSKDVEKALAEDMLSDAMNDQYSEERSNMINDCAETVLDIWKGRN